MKDGSWKKLSTAAQAAVALISLACTSYGAYVAHAAFEACGRILDQPPTILSQTGLLWIDFFRLLSISFFVILCAFALGSFCWLAACGITYFRSHRSTGERS